jgi:cytochrome c553
MLKNNAWLLPRCVVGWSCIWLWGVSVVLAAEPAISPADAEQFEKEIRPLLITHCTECHGSKKQEFGLRLDRRESFLKGSDNGPITKTPDATQGTMWKAIHRTGDSPMPPEKKLPDSDLNKLADWLKRGAPWPVEATVPSGPSIAELASKHWAFQAIVAPAVPDVPAFKDWIKQPLDAFIAEQYADKKLKPTVNADPRTLIRRLTIDLTGLPATMEEVEAFARDPSPAAYEQVIDRLLASPHYGERWGRHWLDLARYADTKGYVFQEDRNYPYSYVYRDWVIRALNQDMPYDEFVTKQIAADLLTADPNQPDPERAALGFLTLGRRFLNNKPDIIDDRIDVLMRTTQGLTVGCARCHDHKFDPIPTADYYSLYGVFDNTKELQQPIEKPSPEYEQKLREFEAKVNEQRTAEIQKLQDQVRQTVGDYLLAASFQAGDEEQPEVVKKLGKVAVSKVVLERWKKELESAKQQHSPILAPWLALSAIPEKEFAAQTAPLCQEIAAGKLGDKPIHPLVQKQFEGEAPDSIQTVAEKYSALFAKIEAEWQASIAAATELAQEQPKQHPDKTAEELRRLLYAKDGPAKIPDDQGERALDKKTRDKIKKTQDEVNAYRNSKAAPLQAFVIVDQEKIAADHPIFIRGNSGRHGPRVKKHFLTAWKADQPTFQKGSGRLELAEQIASPNNPLTARVLVNRVWLHHFGTGLVTTASDFGLRTELPTHAKLLDYLAARFMADGWSLKKLHKQILLSATYQLASNDNPESRNIDPENMFYWRANRRRLDLETMRDSLLLVTGTLDRTAGGPGQEMVNDVNMRRRSIYGFIERQNLPGYFRTFDFASPDNHTPQRFQTTVPQQALYLLNHQFVIELATAFSKREDFKSAQAQADKVTLMYQAAFARKPSSEELQAAAEYLGDTPAQPTDKQHHQLWLRFAQALLLTNEFAFVD